MAKKPLPYLYKPALSAWDGRRKYRVLGNGLFFSIENQLLTVRLGLVEGLIQSLLKYGLSVDLTLAK